jgi:DNA-directed RNA polymerase specialized sigma24 family protein
MSRSRRDGASALHLVRSADLLETSSDAEIVGGLVRGERLAQRLAWERYAPIVYRLAHRALGSPEDARDVMQDTLLCVFAKAAASQGGSHRSETAFRRGATRVSVTDCRSLPGAADRVVAADSRR